MDISSISKTYEMVDIEVTPEQLLLDPYNPRIALDMDEEVKYTSEELASPDVQEFVLSVINKKEHHIADLIKGFRTSGYLKGTAPIIVKKIPNNDKYLILEGNRRITAIKHLLYDECQLNPTILNTLKKLNVNKFKFYNKGLFAEEDVIDILLGSLHLKGTLDWGAMERASYIYKSYMRSLKNEFGNKLKFSYLASHANKIASFYNLKPIEVKKSIMVSRIYEQLKDQGYPVRQDHYTLIEMVVSNKVLSQDFFVLDDKFHFSIEGLEDFAHLCISEDRPITNPKLFKAFETIYKKGTEHELNLAYHNTMPMFRILEGIKKRGEKKKFLNELETIKKRLEKLVLADYQGTVQEIRVAKEIKDLVKNKLARLTKKRL